MVPCSNYTILHQDNCSMYVCLRLAITSSSNARGSAVMPGETGPGRWARGFCKHTAGTNHIICMRTTCIAVRV